MSRDNFYNDEALDSVLMEVYGLSRDQYYSYNSDYQSLLLKQFYKILKKQNGLSEEVKTKKKILNRFKKIGG